MSAFKSLPTVYATIFLACRVLPAQDPKSVNTFAYEVVSVRPFHGDDRRGNLFNNGSSLVTDTSLDKVVQYAFGVQMPDQIVGIPAWANSTRYVISAKIVNPDTVAALNRLPIQQRLDQRRRMCIAILVERFGLAFHRKTKNLPVYNLVIAKGGPKMKTSSAETSSSSMDRESLSGSGMKISEVAQRLSNTLVVRSLIKLGLLGSTI